MEKITAAEAARLAGGTVKGDPNAEISSVSLNSREILTGGLFVPLVGRNSDGHDFIEDAAKNGAAAALCSRKEQTASIPLIMTDDVQTALTRLAAEYRKRFDIPTVGITGSVGKTTVKEMTAAISAQEYNTLKTEKNFNGEQGLPLTLLRLEKSYQAAVIEMGMSNFGELSRYSRTARPDIAVITNIGLSHVEYLGSREGVLKAKLEILDGLADGGTLIINGDDDMLWEIRNTVGVKVVTYGVYNREADVRAENVIQRDGKLTFDIVCGPRKIKACIHTIGRHNVPNALAAACAGMSLGLSDAQIAAGLSAFRTQPMRQHIFERNGFFIIDDTYNASYDSIVAALKMLSELGEGRKFAALGGISELGAMHEQVHTAVGEQAAKYADALYLFGKGAEFYAEGAKRAGMAPENIHIFDDKKELARKLREQARPGDTVLFKGSRFAMRMEQALQMFIGEDV